MILKAWRGSSISIIMQVGIMQDPHSHRLSLPRKLSKSGQKPSPMSRAVFVLLGFFLFLVLANAVVAAAVEGLIYPGVSVAGHDLSWKTRSSALKVLREASPDKTITIKSDGKFFIVKSNDLGASYDLPATVDLAYQVGRQRPLPLLSILSSNGNGQLGFAYRLNQEKFNSEISKITNSVGRDPVNAKLTINEGQIQVSPPQPGVKISTNYLVRLLNQSLTSAKDQVAIVNPIITQADIQVDSTKSAQDQAKLLMRKKIILNYNGRNFSPDSATIGHWIVFKEIKTFNKPTIISTEIDPSQVKGYVQSVANQINQAPKNKKIMIRDGVTSVEQEGVEGLAIDQDATTSSLVEAMKTTGESSYEVKTNKVAYKTETNRSYGLDLDRYIEINLSQQKLWAYDKGQVVFSSPITSGATGAGFPTVTGLFHVYYKNTNTYLNGRPYGYNYNVFVKYWMPFYQGYGLHDASWRSSFGGSDYYYGGSHGCVNMPESSAAFLYSWADVGTAVWVHK